MLNTAAVFTRLDLGTSAASAVQRIREEVEGATDQTKRANELIKAITGVDYEFKDATFARLVAMGCGEGAFKANHQIDDPAIFVDGIVTRVDKMMADPGNAWMFVKPVSTAVTGTVVQVVKDLDVKVAVKDNGKIKKGGKQVLAAELYKKYVLNVAADKALDNQGFIAILMKELDMSLAGARTYAFNCKRDLGEPVGGLKKGKRGKKAKAKTAAPAKAKGKKAAKK